jgi:hypothetical protein
MAYRDQRDRAAAEIVKLKGKIEDLERLNDRHNLPPADELFVVRAEIKRLETREAELRQVILSDPSARTGNHYIASLVEVVSRRVDLKEMRAMHPQTVEEFTFPTKTVKVELFEVDEESGEITRPKREAAKPAELKSE